MEGNAWTTALIGACVAVGWAGNAEANPLIAAIIAAARKDMMMVLGG